MVLILYHINHTNIILFFTTRGTRQSSLLQIMMLSDIDIKNLEAELEKDLDERINQHEDASNAQPSLLHELDSLRESISNKDDDDNQLQSFEILANARSSISSFRRGASEIVQSINDELLESRNDAASNTYGQSEHTIQEEKVHLPTQDDTIFSLTQIPSSATNDDVVDQSESDSSSDCEKDDCVADTATNDCCETELDQTSSAVDKSFEQAMIEANDQLCMIEEKHRMKRLILEQRKELLCRNRNAKRLQKWYQRINTRRRLLLASFVSSLTSNTVQSAVEVGLSQCSDVLESTVDCSNRPIILRSSRVLSIPQTRQMMNWNDLNCRQIVVIRDPSNYKVHIFIFYQRHLKHYVFHLRRRLTDEVVKTSSVLLLRYSDDSETRFSQFTRQTLPIHNLGVQPLLLPNLSPPLMIENGPTALDLTDKSSLCLILCQMTQRVMTRRALHALQCLKATVQIQSIYRGFVVRRRLESIQCTAFDYIDSEIDDILGDNSKDMLQFDEEALGEEEVSWNPCKPYIEPTVNCSIDETDMISSTGEADSIPKLESKPLHHRVLSSTSRAQYHDNELEDTTSRRKAATPKIVRRDNLKERESESYTTWQKMKVKNIRVAQVSEYVILYVYLFCNDCYGLLLDN